MRVVEGHFGRCPDRCGPGLRIGPRLGFCALPARGTSSTSVDVRVNAVFALGFIANDSTVDRMADLSGLERDSSVHRAYLSAMFLNLQRRGKFKETGPAVYYLERGEGQNARAQLTPSGGYRLPFSCRIAPWCCAPPTKRRTPR